MASNKEIILNCPPGWGVFEDDPSRGNNCRWGKIQPANAGTTLNTSSEDALEVDVFNLRGQTELWPIESMVKMNKGQMQERGLLPPRNPKEPEKKEEKLIG